MTVFLGIGSNLGDRQSQLLKAIESLSVEVGKVEQQSSVYRTAPWGDPNQPDYFNQVVQLTTDQPVGEVLRFILGIEQRMGRVRHTGQRNAPRAIDIDILYYGKELVEVEGLQVPHPRAHLRNFVLVPMREIAPEWIDPLSGKTIRELAADSPDDLKVWREEGLKQSLLDGHSQDSGQ